MPGQPLKPFLGFAPLTILLSNSISIGMAMEWLLCIVFTFWALYTLVAIYHWLKYSHASWVAFPAIALHFFISFALMVYALSGALIV